MQIRIEKFEPLKTPPAPSPQYRNDVYAPAIGITFAVFLSIASN